MEKSIKPFFIKKLFWLLILFIFVGLFGRCLLFATAIRYRLDNLAITLLNIDKSLTNTMLPCKNTPIILTVSLNNIKLTEELIRRKANLNFIDSAGYAAIHYATESENVEMIQLLVNSGADVNLKSKYGEDTPLHIAVKNKSLKVIDTLIKLKAKIYLTNSLLKNPLHMACLKGDFNIVKRLLELGYDVNCREEWLGSTPLHLANNVDTVKVLLSFKANVNTQDNIGETPLLEQASCGNVSIVKLLIKNGANVNLATKGGTTPLHWADNIEIAEILLENGAKKNAHDIDGKTPMDAVYPHRIEIAKFIKSWKKK